VLKSFFKFDFSGVASSNFLINNFVAFFFLLLLLLLLLLIFESNVNELLYSESESIITSILLCSDVDKIPLFLMCFMFEIKLFLTIFELVIFSFLLLSEIFL